MTDQILGSAASASGSGGKGKKQAEGPGFEMPNRTKIEKLNQAATAKLAEIVRRNTAGEALWQGYDAREIAAARDLLDKSTLSVER